MAHRVCPWWIGYFLLVPLRRIGQDPRTILSPYVTAGMTVLEPGPGMGFFTLELARLVGPAGHVVAVDVAVDENGHHSGRVSAMISSVLILTVALPRSRPTAAAPRPSRRGDFARRIRAGSGLHSRGISPARRPSDPS